MDMTHDESNNDARIFFVNKVIFNGYLVAMNLSTAIKNRLRIETEWETFLMNTPTLQLAVATKPLIRLPRLVIISSVRYSGQVIRQERKSDTAILT